MARVFVKLEGGKIDIEDLRDILKTTEWTILKDGELYYITSKILDQLSDYREIILKTDEYLGAAIGAAHIFYSNFGNVKTGNIKIIGEQGANYVCITGTAHIKVKSRLRGTLTNVGDNTTRKTTPQSWLAKSERYLAVKDVLRFFNNITWINLYKIYEIIRDDIGQTGVNELIPKKKLDPFTQGAQSREFIGDDARHASKKYKVPEKKITLEQATALIATLFQKWVDNKP